MITIKTDRHYWLVVTDLDGTLLDHHTYRFDAAKEALAKLTKLRVPVIINSSKTAGEINALRNTLNNQHPFIAENGSGIFIPKNYFSNKPEAADDWGDLWKINLGKPRAQLITALEQTPKKFRSCYRAFHSLSPEEIMELTGLTKAESALANERHFSEPLHWIGNDTERRDFYQQLKQQGIYFTEGGRFIHLMGHSNKGSATHHLSRYYQREHKAEVKVVALGDGNNDIDMLASAAIAVVIQSPVNTQPEFDHPCKIISENVWSRRLGRNH